MGFWNTVKQVKYERQGGTRSQYGITRSSDSDVRCVECKKMFRVTAGAVHAFFGELKLM